MNSTENINMLIEIISEDPIFKSTDYPGLKEECVKVLMEFYENEKSINQDLMTANKKYLSFMLNKIKNMRNVEKIEPYHSKDIIAERQNNYEKQFQLKKEEFENAITLKPPPTPQFTDKKDAPIDMDRELKKIMERRNLDILPEKKIIRIDSEDIQTETNVIDLNKKITWADESIFLKLKKIKPESTQELTQPPIQEQLNNINIKLDLILSKLSN